MFCTADDFCRYFVREVVDLIFSRFVQNITRKEV